jgi:hypothetical protein
MQLRMNEFKSDGGIDGHGKNIQCVMAIVNANASKHSWIPAFSQLILEIARKLVEMRVNEFRIKGIEIE